MSARNGDKSRFNRERKQKIARRKRIHEMLAMRALPPPLRDSEGRPEKSAATGPSLDDLLKEELR
jgi:hypothetical protein